MYKIDETILIIGNKNEEEKGTDLGAGFEEGMHLYHLWNDEKFESIGKIEVPTGEFRRLKKVEV